MTVGHIWRIWPFLPRWRGPATGSTLPVTQTLLSPAPPNDGCADVYPAAQTIPVACCYNSNGYGDLTGNDHGMFAHATATGNFWHTASLASGFSTGPYPNSTPDRTWYLLEPVAFGCGLQEGNPLALPGQTANFQSPQTPQGGTCGKSDERCYLLTLSSLSPSITIDGNSFTDAKAYFGASTGVSYFVLDNEAGGFHVGLGHNSWCKFSDHFYCPANFGGFGSPDWRMTSFPIPSPTGAFQDASVPLASALTGWNNATMDAATAVVGMHATSGFLWVLANAAWDGGPTELRLYKLNRATMTHVAHWTLTGDPNFALAWNLHAFSDDLIFLIQDGTGGNPWKIGYFRPDTAATTVIGTVTQQCTEAGNAVGAPGQSGFYYAKNYFYLAYSGFGFGTTNVLKLGPLTCPSNASLPWEDF